jgi:ribonuclease D
MTITLHKGDLPDDVTFTSSVAIDTETMGLQTKRDPLCLVQLSSGDGNAHLVQMDRETYDAPNLAALMEDESIVKIFHFARFDVAALTYYLGAMPEPVYCTKIASKLVRTYTDRHGLKDLCRELLSVDLSKQQQSSDWGAQDLSQAQQAYAASDVLYLHDLKTKLDDMLAREERTELAQACFDFLPIRGALDLEGWPDVDIFAH